MVSYKKCFDLQKYLAETYLGFFHAVMEGGCYADYDAKMMKVFEQIGLNTEVVMEFGVARAGMILASNTPGFPDLKAKVDRYFEMLYKFFWSQEGFETFPESENLRKNPNNTKFFTLMDRLMANMRALPDNPQAIRFSEKTATDFAQAIFWIAGIDLTCWKNLKYGRFLQFFKNKQKFQEIQIKNVEDSNCLNFIFRSRLFYLWGGFRILLKWF